MNKLSEENRALVAAISDEDMRALLDRKDVASGRATLLRLLNAARSEALSSPGAGRDDIARAEGGGEGTATGRVIDLKTWPGPFAAVRAGLKPWELRLDDRGYQVGDLLRLREWSPDSEAYTGEVEERLVIWKLDGGSFGLPTGFCIMSLVPTRASGLAPASLDTDRRPEPREARSLLSEAKALTSSGGASPSSPDGRSPHGS